MSHVFVSQEHGAFTPDGRIDADRAEADRLNAETTAAELAFWATAPEQFAPAYYSFPNHPGGKLRQHAPFYPSNTGAHVSTWTGTKLGDIIEARVYPHNFGSRMVSLKVRGTNGAIYSGRASWDNGSVIRLRKVTR